VPRRLTNRQAVDLKRAEERQAEREAADAARHRETAFTRYFRRSLPPTMNGRKA
jgi:hypothetical protein